MGEYAAAYPPFAPHVTHSVECLGAVEAFSRLLSKVYVSTSIFSNSEQTKSVIEYIEYRDASRIGRSRICLPITAVIVSVRMGYAAGGPLCL